MFRNSGSRECVRADKSDKNPRSEQKENRSSDRKMGFFPGSKLNLGRTARRGEELSRQPLQLIRLSTIVPLLTL